VQVPRAWIVYDRKPQKPDDRDVREAFLWPLVGSAHWPGEHTGEAERDMGREAILIIDPDENSRYLLSLLVDRLGYEFKAVEDLKRGLSHLEDGHFTVVIAEASLFKPKEILKTQDLHPGICFIFIANSAECFKEHIKPGASDFLSKPFGQEEAEFRLKRIIVEREKHSQYEEAERELQAARRELQRKNRELDSSMDDLERIKHLYKDIGTELNTTSEKLRRAKDQLEVLAITDGLTEVYNHRYFVDQIHERFRVAKAQLKPLSLLMIDIDHFKTFNDNHGHMQGDLVLRRIAHILKSSCRSADIVARYGGEEFAIILSETDSKKAEMVAERIRKLVEDCRPPDGSEDQCVTISIGVGSTGNGVEAVDHLISSADKALYQAKNAGRNRVERFANTPNTETPATAASK
jgi:diguanylate cyclase (GGDEF)-like protein